MQTHRVTVEASSNYREQEEISTTYVQMSVGSESGIILE